MDDLARLGGPDRRTLIWAPVAIGAAILLGLVWLWPRSAPTVDLTVFGITDQVHRARVASVEEGPCSYSAESRCVTVVFELLEGPTPGTVAAQEFELLPTTPDFMPGEAVMLNFLPDAPAELQYQYADKDRRVLLLAVAVLFAGAVVALGRLRGLAALLGLALGVGVLLWFVLPAILQGSSPVLVAAVGAAAIGYVALYLAHGWNDLTHVAVIGTFGSLILTLGLSAVVVELARLTGFSGEEALYLTLLGPFDIRGLLLAGIVLGALGALDDVTVTQASAVWEIHRANPGMATGELFSAGLRVGRDHIASTVNTLVLAYAGASMPLLLLFAVSRQPLDVIANSEVVAIEIIRTLVGSIGLVASVPLTTWLAARTVGSAARAES
ncbi:MAG: hypothetical protein KatS3mg011_0232 [Acidimicrobiia bacterium]|nr:MAG: hypothetical protein KatS3mg011_0232 [Acidimicrobiia bacterium]